MSGAPLLEVEGLEVGYPSRGGLVRAVRDVGFTLGRERLGVVGESGSGKSTTARAISADPAPGTVKARKLAFDGRDLRRLGEREWRALRGRRLSMVMQDPKILAEPRAAHRRADHGDLSAASPVQPTRGGTAHPWRCWKGCASEIRNWSFSSIRINFPAAWANAR